MAPIKMKRTAGTKRTAPAVADPSGSYLISVQAARFYHQTRYYWTICRAEKPDELVSWGDAPNKQAAELAARSEIADLNNGFSDGGARTPHFGPLSHHHS